MTRGSGTLQGYFNKRQTMKQDNANNKIYLVEHQSKTSAATLVSTKNDKGIAWGFNNFKPNNHNVFIDENRALTLQEAKREFDLLVDEPNNIKWCRIIELNNKSKKAKVIKDYKAQPLDNLRDIM